jgi:hypothetical protein
LGSYEIAAAGAHGAAVASNVVEVLPTPAATPPAPAAPETFGSGCWPELLQSGKT